MTADAIRGINTGVNVATPSIDAHFAGAYRQLRRLAHARLRSVQRTSLMNTTALVHESYLRLAACNRLELNDRSHFLAYAGRAMRSVMVDLVRRRFATRHGGSQIEVTLSDDLNGDDPAAYLAILRVHEALDDLAKLDLRMVRIVEMRYFAGMTETEVAEALSMSDRTVRREWEKARLWLSQAL